MSYASQYYFLIVLFNLINQKQADTATITCINQFEETKVFDTLNTSMEKIALGCFDAYEVSLQGENTLVLSGKDDLTLALLLGIRVTKMCIFVENSTAENINAFIKNITGSCEGPLLTFVNNPILKYLTFEIDLYDNIRSIPHAIRVRANKMLAEEHIDTMNTWNSNNESVDIQGVGECPLPKPFSSFQSLDNQCTSFYGFLVLEQGVTEISYNSSETHEIKLEGCVQIENTELKDLTFLYLFSRFKPIPSCPQFVRNNRKLCPSNLNYLNIFFKTVDFYNNSEETCSECVGGKVSEFYLRESANCTYIYGDLIISGLRGTPPNIGNLRGIESIEGRLIITNNTGLNTFGYLHSLKKVGLRNEQEAAVVVRDNADLEVLKMPILLSTELQKEGKQVELANNPMLSLGDEQAEVELTTAEQTAGVFVSSSKASGKKRRQTFKKRATANGFSKAALLGTMIALLWNLPLDARNYVGVQRRKLKRLPPQTRARQARNLKRERSTRHQVCGRILREDIFLEGLTVF